MAFATVTKPVWSKSTANTCTVVLHVSDENVHFCGGKASFTTSLYDVVRHRMENMSFAYKP